jgi:hypothetical protein
VAVGDRYLSSGLHNGERKVFDVEKAHQKT